MCHRRSLKFAHSLSHLLLLKSFHQSPQQAIRLIGHGTTSSPLLVSSSHPISLSNLVHATRSTATRLVSLLLPALSASRIYPLLPPWAAQSHLYSILSSIINDSGAGRTVVSRHCSDQQPAPGPIFPSPITRRVPRSTYAAARALQ